MLIARPLSIPAPVLTKRARGVDVSAKNAFPRDAVVEFTLRIPRASGITGAALSLRPDGGEVSERPFAFFASAGGLDTYRLFLPLPAISPETDGLFFYELIFYRGAERLHSDTADNATFTLSESPARPFRLLVFEADFSTPARFHGRTMYHIFVDRFALGGAPSARGGGERRADAVYHEKWDEEITQYAAYAGAPVANNEFFGGTLWGVLDKLDYLCSLGVGAIYLSPIFAAYSNHKYDTGDHETVAPEFGGEAAFAALLSACRKRDILVILDGVFNHTGDDSKYFNRYGKYPETGAFQSKNSPYFHWYFFKEHPHRYRCWWDIPILPKLDLENPEVVRYFLGEDGIVAKWTRAGADGWRLDVADELPNAFLEGFRARVKAETNGEGVVLGEVWENAADKIAYGERRRYFLGRQLDGVMNYPLREGLIAFARGGDAAALCRVLRELWSSYPTPACHALMNILSTHDTARILTVLGGESAAGHSNAELRDLRLSPAARTEAKRRLMIAAALQYTVFGVPSLFYGDEAGLEGYRDPFCRRPYPWGREDADLLTFYRKLGKIRRESRALADGDFTLFAEAPHALAFMREGGGERLIAAANRGREPFALALPAPAVELLRGRKSAKRVVLPPDTVAIWRIGHVQKSMGKTDEKQKPREQTLPL